MKKLTLFVLTAMVATTACQQGQAAPTPNVDAIVQATIAAQTPQVVVVTATLPSPTETPVQPTPNVGETVAAAVSTALALQALVPTASAPPAQPTATGDPPAVTPLAPDVCVSAVSANMTGADVTAFINGLPNDRATHFRNDSVSDPGTSGEVLLTSDFGPLKGLDKKFWESGPDSGVSMFNVPVGYCLVTGDELGGGGHQIVLGSGLHNLQKISRPKLGWETKDECQDGLQWCWNDHSVWAVLKQ